MTRVWPAIVLTGIGTFAMRASFLAAAHRLTNVRPGLQRLLRQIPPAALAALVFPALLRPDGVIDLWQPRLAAGLVAALVAWRTRNIAVTLAVGLGGLFLLEQLL